jgi:hypothetical protein
MAIIPAAITNYVLIDELSFWGTYGVEDPETTTLLSPIVGTPITLSYDNSTETALTFAWTAQEGASSYEIVFSKAADLSSPISVTGIAGTTKAFTNQELQDLLIEPDAFGLSRYKPNTVYWNVKATGGDYFSSPSRIELSGMPVFIDSRNSGNEEIIYKVATIKYGTYEAVWMAEDLRTKYAADGTDLTTLLVDDEHFSDYADGPQRVFAATGANTHAASEATSAAVPDYFLSIGTMYYRSLVNSATYLNTGDWKMPTKAQISGLIEAAVAQNTAAIPGNRPNYAIALKDPARMANFNGAETYYWTWRPAADAPEWNAWKMNMGPNGRYKNGVDPDAYFYFNRDPGTDDTHAHIISYLFDYSLEVNKAMGQYLQLTESDNGTTYSFGPRNTNFWEISGLYPVRLIYTGR